MSKRSALVRYVSPFGTPAWMPRERAERLLAEDDARWVWLQEIIAETGDRGLISEAQRAVGGPRIEHLTGVK